MPRPTTLLISLAALAAGCSSGPDSIAPPPERTATAAKPAEGPLQRLELVQGKGFIRFVATKESILKVPGRFGEQAGALELRGNDARSLRGGIDVALETVNTADKARDTSLRVALFEIAEGARATARIDVLSVVPEQAKLAPGQRTAATATLRVGILGGGGTVPASVELGRTDTGWTVRSLEPVQLSMAALGMAAQAAALKLRCSHKDLGDEVAVSFSLEFDG